jgi:hypothetical protein
MLSIFLPHLALSPGRRANTDDVHPSADYLRKSTRILEPNAYSATVRGDEFDASVLQRYLDLLDCSMPQFFASFETLDGLRRYVCFTRKFIDVPAQRHPREPTLNWPNITLRGVILVAHSNFALYKPYSD